MKRVFLCMALVFVLCFSLAACSISGEKDSAKETAAETTEAPAKEKVFESDNELFCIKADENWKDAQKRLEIEDATLSISKNQEAYIALISEYKYNFPSQDGLSGYNELVIKNMEKNVDNEETGKSEKLQIDDYDAYRTVMTGQVEKQNTAYIIYCVEMDDYYVQLVCWNIGNNSDKYGTEFDKIARTLCFAWDMEKEETQG